MLLALFLTYGTMNIRLISFILINKNMGIEEYNIGKVSPMATKEKNEKGEPIMDITEEEAKIATAKLTMDKTEAARLELERAMNEKKTQEQIRAEIKDILKEL